MQENLTDAVKTWVEDGPKVAAKPLIVMVGSDRGGTGKTSVSRVLVDYLARANTAGVKIFDTQCPAGDLQRFVNAAEIVDITRIEDQMKIFDALSGVTVIDLQAGLLSVTLRLLIESGLLEDVKSGTVNLAVMHVLGPNITSLGEIPAVTRMLGGSAKYIPVKNYISENAGFFEWDTNGRLAEDLKRLEPHMIVVPHLVDRACEVVQNKAMSFEAYAQDATQSRMLRGKVRVWLDAVWADFDKVGIRALVDGARQ
jgi:hypothetical protein